MRRGLRVFVAMSVVVALTVIEAPSARAAFALSGPTNYAFTQPTRPQVADLNGDGRPDIVLGTFSGSSDDVGIMLGNADGTFATSTEDASFDHPTDDLQDQTCNGPQSVAVGTLNNDAFPDILAKCLNGPPRTLLGTGTGSFGDSIRSGLTFFAANVLTLGRYDSSSGALDVAYQSFGVTTTPFVGALGFGDGTFNGPDSDQPGESVSNDMVAFDLDGDGRDTPVGIGGDGLRFFNFNTTTGSFENGATRPVPSGANALDVGDIDNDADKDIVVVGSNGGGANPGAVSVLRYDSGFPTTNPPTFTTTDAGVQDIALGDFDNDGNLDVAVMAGGAASGSAATLAIHAGNGDGTFDAAELFSVGNNGDTHSIVAADFDADGKDDLAITVNGVNRVEVWRSSAVPLDTSIVSAPRSVIKTRKRRVSVSFTFSATQPSTFECSLDNSVFASCTSPKSYSVGRGGHIFQVRVIAIATSEVDATPATYNFTVKRKR